MRWPSLERFNQWERILWAAVLVTLPVTSFRYMPFMGDAQVKPLSLVPAALLLVVLVCRCLRERRLTLWSHTLLPLLLFVFIALISSAVGFTLAPLKLYSYAYEGRVLRAWVSLGVGLVFLVTSIAMNRNEDDLLFTIKWVYVGFAVEIVWSLIQLFGLALALKDHHYVFDLIDQIQRSLLMGGLPPNQRISGLALEPSWLAAQVLTLYLPWAIAAIITGYGWSKRPWLAPAILAGCTLLLIFTYSRSGILTTIGATCLTFAIAGWDRVQQAWKWMTAPRRVGKDAAAKTLPAILMRLAVICAVLAGLIGGISILSRNNYFAKIWQSNKTNPVAYLVDIYAGPRLAYAWAGWNIFSQHPFTGVGLGAAGLSIQKSFPDWAHFNISEIAQLISSDNTVFPNVKNLYVRLLAETGIVGFWTFMAFYLLLLGKIAGLLRSKQKKLAFVGTASLLAWIGIIVLGISQDSLAMANIWLPLGILVGMTDRTMM